MISQNNQEIFLEMFNRLVIEMENISDVLDSIAITLTEIQDDLR